MKTEQWIIGGGLACFLVLVVAAIMPDDFWDANISSSASVIVSVAGSRAGIANPALQARNAAPGGGAVQQGPPTSWGRNVAMPGLTPFSRASSQRFQGNVVRTISRGTEVGWAQVHIWVANGVGDSRQISLAPDWYLQYLGCPVSENMHVKGTAYKFDTVRSGAKLFAKTIAVNGKTCRLRNDEGFALWSNRLR